MLAIRKPNSAFVFGFIYNFKTVFLHGDPPEKKSEVNALFPQGLIPLQDIY